MTTSTCGMMAWGRVFLLCCVVFSITRSSDLCKHIVPYSREHLYILKNPVCWETDGIHLKKSLTDWLLAEDQLNLNYFPMDQNRQNYVREVRNAVFSHVLPTPFQSKVKLAAVWDHVLLKVLDLHLDVAHSQDFIQVVSGSKILKGSTPLAHRYGGHQFGTWADQLGDGRAHLLGEYVNWKGERWELQLKGSGKTPYSRRGDGRAVIRSSVREFLAAEAMYFLGIPTSRAATLSVTGDPVIRDQFYNGNIKRERAAVVLRLAPSWLRIGSFEILTFKGEYDILEKLKNFVITQYFPEIDLNDPNHILDLFDSVVSCTADLMAMWQTVGFAHGVMNTDNFSILCKTIDYGPFRFLDEYDPGMVPNSSDDEHRYSFEKQPDVGWFNLNKLRIALEPLADRPQKRQLTLILDGYANKYKRKFMEIFKEKVGIKGYDIRDEYLVGMLLKMMEDTKADFTMTLRQLSEWPLVNISASQVPKSLWSVFKLSTHEFFQEFCKLYQDRINSSGLSASQRVKLMNQRNPRYIIRNWMAQEAIAKAEVDDFRYLHFLQKVLSRPYTYQEEADLAGFADPPPTWASQLRVSCSS